MNLPVAPMLAASGQPFDSEEYLFEIKWDGVRALAAVTMDRCQVWGRNCADYSGRYPELNVLSRLPVGTVVDGELVLLRDGLPDLAALLHRHPLVRPEQIRRASQLSPVRYVLFDLLTQEGRSLLAEPLHERRARLAELVAKLAEPGVVLSEGVIGTGQEYCQRVMSQGHEGVMAKRLTSHYFPGRRSPSWRKIKPAQEVPCVVIGYTPGQHGIRSLLVAAVRAGALRYVGRLASGMSERVASELQQRLSAARRAAPVVPCPHRALWVEPTVYCRAKFLRWTAQGHLRDAVFRGLLADDAAITRRGN
jgi:DNA ligase D-like protein (predicted ligase)